MRITNGMMINNTLNNINRNKTNMDNLFTQMSSEKKIQRPSEDPIIAIRALRFRSTLSEIEQYTERNIKDAESWLKITDDALGNVVKLVGDIKTYCNQAVNGYYDNDNKASIVETITAFRDQIYSGANTDCAGRTIFTGYKTDQTLSFTEEDLNASYEMTEGFKKEDFDNIRKITDSVNISGINIGNVGAFDTSTVKAPGYMDAYRIRLAYDNLTTDSSPDITCYKKNADGTTTVETVAATPVSVTNASAYQPADDKVHFIPETGEYIFGKEAYTAMMQYDSFDITYTKTGFQKGELNPIHYFDCTDKNTNLKYTAKEQPIRYEISFNQTLQVNVQGSNVFTHDMARDLDDIVNAVNTVADIENKISQLQFMYDSAEEDSTERKKIQVLIDNCKRELDFAKDESESRFASALTKYENHATYLGMARADVGSREIRLELVAERLETQQKTVKELQSVNEQVNTAEIAVEYRQAESIYDASLAAAAKVVKNKLIDFI